MLLGWLLGGAFVLVLVVLGWRRQGSQRREHGEMAGIAELPAPSALPPGPAEHPATAPPPLDGDSPSAPISENHGHGARPARLGRFQIESQIGRGAMGRLYRARDIRSGQAVAIKTLELARDFSGARLDDARQRFRREAEAAWRLSHPDIVQVLDAGEDQGLAYIAMELLSGHDLTHHILPEQRLGVPQVLAIGRRVAGALAHAHRQGVIHRDIKPANIMIDLPQGQIKVTDFGIARLSNTARTRTGLVLGSPLYMSPEQISGQQVDERTDLYSLGLVLHQLLSGRPPVEAASLGELMRAVVERPIPGLHQVRPDLPQDLVDVIELCLQKQAELRTRSAQDLATDLQLVIDRHGLECEFGVASTAASPTNPAPTGITPAGNGETFMHNRPV